jgi:hypothetical protein
MKNAHLQDINISELAKTQINMPNKINIYLDILKVFIETHFKDRGIIYNYENSTG